jgi:hypothetical protein
MWLCHFWGQLNNPFTVGAPTAFLIIASVMAVEVRTRNPGFGGGGSDPTKTRATWVSRQELAYVFTNAPCRLKGSAIGARHVQMGPSAMWRASKTCNSVLPARKLILGPSIQPSISVLLPG